MKVGHEKGTKKVEKKQAGAHRGTAYRTKQLVGKECVFTEADSGTDSEGLSVSLAGKTVAGL
jgi:hypothetical protein